MLPAAQASVWTGSRFFGRCSKQPGPTVRMAGLLLQSVATRMRFRLLLEGACASSRLFGWLCS